MTPAAVLFRRTLSPLLALALAGGLAAGIATARQPPTPDVVLGFVVPIPEERATRATGTAGGTDPVEATDFFVGTLSGWLASPEFAAEVFARAGVRAPVSSVRKLSRVFEARRRGGQVVDVRFQSRSADEAGRIARAVREEVAERAAALAGERQGLAFSAIAGEPLIVQDRPNPFLRGLLAGVVLFVMGVNGVFLWDFLRVPPAGTAGLPGAGT